MKCTDYQRLFNDYLDEQLDSAQHAAVAAHLAGCAACNRSVNSSRAMLQTLRTLPAPSLRNGFFDEAVRRAQRHHARGLLGRLAAGGALAAGLAIAFIAGSLILPSGPQMDAPDSASARTFSMALHQTQNLRMAFTSDEPQQDAEFILRLPEHVSVAGFPGQREIRWHAVIKPGSNELALPLTAQLPDRGQLVTEIRTGKTSRVFRIQLESGPASGEVFLNGRPPARQAAV